MAFYYKYTVFLFKIANLAAGTKKLLLLEQINRLKMIVRIVKMTFQPEHVQEFFQFFEAFKERIRNFPGCTYLQVLQDKDNPNIVFSYSHWNDVSDLDNYRNSELFKTVWPRTKALFLIQPEAWSTEVLHDLK